MFDPTVFNAVTAMYVLGFCAAGVGVVFYCANLRPGPSGAEGRAIVAALGLLVALFFAVNSLALGETAAHLGAFAKDLFGMLTLVIPWFCGLTLAQMALIKSRKHLSG